MTLSLKHTFVSAIADGADTTVVRPSNWNAEHTLTGTASTLSGFNASGVGTDLTWAATDLTNQALSLTSIANPSASTLTLTGGTALTTSQPALKITQAWNAAGGALTAVSIDVTDNGGANVNTSYLIKATRTGVGTLFGVRLGGLWEFSTGAVLGGGNNGVVGYDQGGNDQFAYNSTIGVQAQFFSLGTSPASQNADLFLRRDAADLLAQRRTTNAQARRLAATWTDASNYEYLRLDAGKTTANTHRIMSEAAGTGTARIIAIDGFDKAGAAANTDLPSGTWALIHDTSGATFKLVYNASGTLKTVALT